MQLILIQKPEGPRLVKVGKTLYNRLGGDQQSIQEHMDLSQTERLGSETSKHLIKLLERCDDYPFDYIEV